MVAILILAIALGGLTRGITTALASSKESELQTTAALFAAGQIELLRAQKDLVDGTESGDCGGGLSLYRWKQTVSPTNISGLHEVDVVVENARTGAEIFELKTLLFQIPDDSYDKAKTTKPKKQPDMKTCPSQCLAAAFTLIEVMISSALMALILVSAYLCLGAGFAAQKMIEPRAEIIQNARVAMALMTADLRAACPLSKSDDFLGMTRTVGDVTADNLDFATHNYKPRRAHEGDFCQESFYLDKNLETGQFSLWRRRNPTIALDELSGGSKEEIARGVVGLKLEYFDGLDWYNSWGEVRARGKDQNSAQQKSNLSGLPDAVRITLLMDSNPKKKKPALAAGVEKPEPPLVFQTIVRLNLAQDSQGDSSGADSTNSESTSSPGQSPANGGNN
ncbi:MAG: prepilin-type N-terminal cleavage/methylation domain-containing protein [Limisphaerales bacterium]